MSIVVVVKKDNDIVIASDSLTTHGATLISSKYKINHKKIIQYKDSYIACLDEVISTQMLEHALEKSEDEFYFDRVDHIYSSLLKLHKILKEDYFLSPKNKEDVNQTVEPTNLQLLIANASGIYGVYSDKKIEAFSKFWAIGSGRSLALGAMYHLYDKYDAKKIAELAIKSACAFDETSALPMHMEVISCPS